MSRLIAAATLILLLPSQAATAADDGTTAFNTHCRNCHSAKKGDNRLGPSMHGIFGAPAGQVKGFAAYSGSLAGLVWDEATLDRFIAEPAAVAANTSMNYPLVGDPATRREIIEYLRSIREP